MPAIPVADTIKRVEGRQWPRRSRARVSSPRRPRRPSSADVLRAALAGDLDWRVRLRVARRGARRAREGRRGRSSAAEGDDAAGSRASPRRCSDGRPRDRRLPHASPRRSRGASTFAPHAVGPFVETAIARGVEEIGFTEHVYYFRQTAEIWDVPYLSERCVYDLDVYCDAVLEAKRAGLPVKLGHRGGLRRRAAGAARGAARAVSVRLPARLGALARRDGGRHVAGRLGVMTVDEVWQRYTDALCELAVSRDCGRACPPGSREDLRHGDRTRTLLAELHERAALAIGGRRRRGRDLDRRAAEAGR